MIRIDEHADLLGLNTFRLPGSARWLARVDSECELAEVLRDVRFAGVDRFMLGGGSNLVLRKKELDALVLHFASGSWREESREGNQVRIAVDAGMRWHDLVAATVNAGLGGLENLALIPGSVGAAPVQNIGAYGVELESVLHSVDTLDLSNGDRRIFLREECGFGYRDSLFKRAKNRFAITRVRLLLRPDGAPDIAYRDLREEWAARNSPPPTRALVFDMVCAIRRRKLPDPAVIGNAGSFFKNPVISAVQFTELKGTFPGVVGYPQADGSVKVAAGWLIDRAGWKGRRMNGIGVHEKQALVLVHHNDDEGKRATGDDVLALATCIAEDIHHRFGISLEMEPVVC